MADLDGVLRMFSSLTRISQIEANDRTAAFRTVDLAEIAREVVELFDAAAEDKGGHLDAAGDERVLVTGDRDLLFEAMANLVDNAIKHGRQAGRVTVEVRRAMAVQLFRSPMTGREFLPMNVSTCSSASTGSNEVAAPRAMGWGSALWLPSPVCMGRILRCGTKRRASISSFGFHGPCALVSKVWVRLGNEAANSPLAKRARQKSAPSINAGRSRTKL